MSLPALLRWAGAGNGDLALAAFYVGSIVYLVRWIAAERAADLAFAMLFSVYAAFTKNEGLALALVNAVVLGTFCLVRPTRSRGWLGLAAYGLGLLVLLGPWLMFRANLPKTHEDYG